MSETAKNLPLTAACHFCQIAERSDHLRSYDRPFSRSLDYFAIASIGALVHGWTLVCPTRHVVNLQEHYARAAFRSFLNDVARTVAAHYGDCVFFEHGANWEESVTGCGVNHAHFHIVPSVSLSRLLMSADTGWQTIQFSRIRAFVGQKEYLFYADSVDNADPEEIGRASCRERV